jgi:hypothetical protein
MHDTVKRKQAVHVISFDTARLVSVSCVCCDVQGREDPMTCCVQSGM